MSRNFQGRQRVEGHMEEREYGLRRLRGADKLGEEGRSALGAGPQENSGSRYGGRRVLKSRIKEAGLYLPAMRTHGGLGSR